jgi:ribonuclease P protein subunit RPR2
MVRKASLKPRLWQTIAKERIRILFREARKEFREHPDRSRKYVKLARRIGMRYNVRIPKDLKRKFCKKCFSYLVPGVSCKVRTRSDKKSVVLTCSNCGEIMRYPYIREKQINKKGGLE